VLVALAVWLLLTLGLRPLLVPDEGRYAEIARAMLSDDWLVPKLNGLPFFHKPPLFYWIDAAAMQVFGVHEFAGRMGSAVGGWIMGAALWFGTRRSLGQRAASIALSVLATTPFFFVGAQYANHDMLVAGLITAAVFAFARAVEQPPRVDLRWVAAGWAMCGLALLSKGLIGVVLPALVVGPWLLVQGRWRQLVRLMHPFGLTAFALIAAPWYLAMQARYPGFFDYVVVEQHFRRYVQTDFNNVQGFWFFIVVLPALTLPWSLWLPGVPRNVHERTDPLNALCHWWIVVVVGFFSFPSSKLVGYVLPALAPWCLVLARSMVSDGPGHRLTAARRWALPAAAAFCVAIVVASLWARPGSSRELALKLRSLKAPTDRVVMVGEYDYDLPFYAALTAPVLIVDHWDDPDIARRDNWRKEMTDAARFDPTLGKQLLRLPSEMDRLSCEQSDVWFIVPNVRAASVAGLTGSDGIVYQGFGRQLWRVKGRKCLPFAPDD
jgi:4-amino-4-deoxy-L-arabinose transferase-like glycosyltransferase